MKKSLFLIILVSAMLFTACNKTKTEEPVVEDVPVQDDYVEELVVLPEVPCVLFYDSGYLWTLNEKGTLDADTQLQCGVELMAYAATPESKLPEVEAYEFSRTGKKEIETYTHVNYDDKDYWINSDLIQPNSFAAIINDSKAVVYNSADIVDVGNKMIPQYQLVAVNKDFNDVNFSQITYRTENKSSRNVFAKKTAISSHSNDVLCYRVLNKASSIKDIDVLYELYENCKALNLSSEMEDKLEEDFLKFISDLED